MSHVFISYSRQDQAYARKLADHLLESGYDVWIDDRIDYGDRWWKTIVEAIQGCAAFVVIMTPDAEESEWVEREVLVAQRERKPIFPLLRRGRALTLLITAPFADVTDGSLPPPDFYDRLKPILTPRVGTGRSVVPPPPEIRTRALPPDRPLRRRSRGGRVAAALVVVLIGAALAILALLSRGGGEASSIAGGSPTVEPAAEVTRPATATADARTTTPTPTASLAATPTATATPSPSATPTATFTPSPSATPTATFTLSAPAGAFNPAGD